MNILKRSGIFVILFLVLAGCTVFPRTDDLKEVHAVYRKEFTAAKLPTNTPGTRSEARILNSDSFNETFAAIADYRRNNPDALKQLNHLTVLEGMIYLQTGQFGMAELASNDVKKAGENLTDSGSAPRDALFAKSYAAMLEGWKEIRSMKIAGSPTASSLDAEIKTLATAAGRITNNLCSDKDRLKVVEGDQGASYIATTGAIFYYWADFSVSDGCNNEVFNKTDRQCSEYHKNAVYLANARDLIRPFLPQAVQQNIGKFELSQVMINPENKEELGGGIRYLDYYLRIVKKIQSRVNKKGGMVRSYVDPCLNTN